jgi:hypothetical protein
LERLGAKLGGGLDRHDPSRFEPPLSNRAIENIGPGRGLQPIGQIISDDSRESFGMGFIQGFDGADRLPGEL